MAIDHLSKSTKQGKEHRLAAVVEKKCGKTFRISAEPTKSEYDVREKKYRLSRKSWKFTEKKKEAILVLPLFDVNV